MINIFYCVKNKIFNFIATFDRIYVLDLFNIKQGNPNRFTICFILNPHLFQLILILNRSYFKNQSF